MQDNRRSGGEGLSLLRTCLAGKRQQALVSFTQENPLLISDLFGKINVHCLLHFLFVSIIVVVVVIVTIVIILIQGMSIPPLSRFSLEYCNRTSKAYFFFNPQRTQRQRRGCEMIKRG